KEFWDGVNFRGGANPPRDEWKLPRQKTPEETRAAYQNFEDYIRFISRFSDVKFITASEAANIYRGDAPTYGVTQDALRSVALNVGNQVTYQRFGDQNLSPAEVFELLMRVTVLRMNRGDATERLRPSAPLGPTGHVPIFKEPITVSRHDFRAAVVDSVEA